MYGHFSVLCFQELRATPPSDCPIPLHSWFTFDVFGLAICTAKYTCLKSCSSSYEVVSELPLNRLERLEWNTILCYLQQKIAADWLSKSNRFQAFPPSLKKFRRGRSVQTVILVQADRTAHLVREYVQLIGAGSVTFAGGPWGYGCT